jgi:hypothetical protein
VTDPQRRYSREETALILRRATDAERREPSAVEGGLTLEEIAAAAREAGIDPAAVRRAAALTPAPATEARSWALGAPVAPEVGARFEGRLPASDRVAFQTVIERAIGRRGALADEPNALVWHEDHGSGRTTVRARQEGAAVLVIAEADRRGHLLLLVLALAALVGIALLPLGGFGGIAALAGPVGAVLVPLAALAVGTRVAWPMLQRPLGRRLEIAVLEVGALVEPPATGGALPGGAPAAP